MKANNRSKITWMGLLLAFALALSFFEMMVSPLLLLPVGMKVGLSNIIVMFALFQIGIREALVIAFLKSGFIFLLKGFTAFFMSLSGAMSSVLVMYLFIKLLGKKQDILATSVLGAVFHNIGQISMASIIIGSQYVIYYLPVLLVSGVVVGCLTGLLLQKLLPRITKIKIINT